LSDPFANTIEFKALENNIQLPLNEGEFYLWPVHSFRNRIYKGNVNELLVTSSQGLIM